MIIVHFTELRKEKILFILFFFLGKNKICFTLRETWLNIAESNICTYILIK